MARGSRNSYFKEDEPATLTSEFATQEDVKAVVSGGIGDRPQESFAARAISVEEPFSLDRFIQKVESVFAPLSTPSFRVTGETIKAPAEVSKAIGSVLYNAGDGAEDVFRGARDRLLSEPLTVAGIAVQVGEVLTNAASQKGNHPLAFVNSANKFRKSYGGALYNWGYTKKEDDGILYDVGSALESFAISIGLALITKSRAASLAYIAAATGDDAYRSAVAAGFEPREAFWRSSVETGLVFAIEFAGIGHFLSALGRNKRWLGVACAAIGQGVEEGSQSLASDFTRNFTDVGEKKWLDVVKGALYDFTIGVLSGGVLGSVMEVANRRLVRGGIPKAEAVNIVGVFVENENKLIDISAETIDTDVQINAIPEMKAKRLVKEQEIKKELEAKDAAAKEKITKEDFAAEKKESKEKAAAEKEHRLAVKALDAKAAASLKKTTADLEKQLFAITEKTAAKESKIRETLTDKTEINKAVNKNIGEGAIKEKALKEESSALQASKAGSFAAMRKGLDSKLSKALLKSTEKRGKAELALSDRRSGKNKVSKGLFGVGISKQMQKDNPALVKAFVENKAEVEIDIYTKFQELLSTEVISEREAVSDELDYLVEMGELERTDDLFFKIKAALKGDTLNVPAAVKIFKDAPESMLRQKVMRYAEKAQSLTELNLRVTRVKAKKLRNNMGVHVKEKRLSKMSGKEKLLSLGVAGEVAAKIFSVISSVSSPISNYFVARVASYEFMINLLFQGSSLVKALSAFNSNSVYAKRKDHFNKLFLEGLKKIVGGGDTEINKFLDAAKKTMSFTLLNDDGVEISFEFSRREFWNIVQMMRQENAPNMSIRILDKGFVSVLDFQPYLEALSLREKQTIDLIEELYRRSFFDTARVYKEVTGKIIVQQRHYAPIRAEKSSNKKSSNADHPAEFFRRESDGTRRSYLEEREGGPTVVVIKDAVESVFNHIENSSFYVGFTHLNSFLFEMLQDAKLTSELAAFLGKEKMEIFTNQVEYLRDVGKTKRYNVADRFFLGLQQVSYVAQLGFKPKIFLQQLTSLIAYANEAKGLAFTKNLPHALLNIKEYHKLFQNEWWYSLRGLPEFDAAAAAPIIKSFLLSQGIATFRKYALLLPKLGDKGAILIGGGALYKSLIDSGMSKADALETIGRATQEWQQTSLVGYKTADVSGQNGVIARLFAQYLNAQQSLARNIYLAFNDPSGIDYKKIVIAVAATAFFSAVSLGVFWSDSEDAFEDWLEEAITAVLTGWGPVLSLIVEARRDLTDIAAFSSLAGVSEAVRKMFSDDITSAAVQDVISVMINMFIPSVENAKRAIDILSDYEESWETFLKAVGALAGFSKKNIGDY